MTGRKQLIAEFVKRNHALCKAVYEQALAKTKESKELEEKARRELLYSDKTYGWDILWALIQEYKKQYVNG